MSLKTQKRVQNKRTLFELFGNFIHFSLDKLHGLDAGVFHVTFLSVSKVKPKIMFTILILFLLLTLL